MTIVNEDLTKLAAEAWGKRAGYSQLERLDDVAQAVAARVRAETIEKCAKQLEASIAKCGCRREDTATGTYFYRPDGEDCSCKAVFSQIAAIRALKEQAS